MEFNFVEEKKTQDLNKSVDEDLYMYGNHEEDPFVQNLTMRCLCNQSYIEELNRSLNDDDDEWMHLNTDIITYEPEIIETFYALLRNVSNVSDQELHLTFKLFIKQTINYLKNRPQKDDSSDANSDGDANSDSEKSKDEDEDECEDE